MPCDHTRYLIYAESEFDDPRPPATVRPTLFVGPSRTGQLLEVMVEEGRHDVTIFHVMVARRKHLDRIGDQ
ncbi:MAG TPA: hypothetical protein VIW24_11045 [Aldersonia sp.]